MPIWVWVVLMYVVIALLLGELYLYGIRKSGKEPTKSAYVLGVLLWPIAVLLGVLNSKKGEKK